MFDIDKVAKDVEVIFGSGNPRRLWSIARSVSETEWIRINGSVRETDKVRAVFAAEGAYSRNEFPADSSFIFPHFRLATLTWSRGGGQCDGRLIEVTDQAEVSRRQAFNDAVRAAREAAARERAAALEAQVADFVARAATNAAPSVLWQLSYVADEFPVIDVLRVLAQNPIIRGDAHLRAEVSRYAGWKYRDEINAIFSSSASDPEPDPDPDPEPTSGPDPEPEPEITNLTPHTLNIRTRDNQIMIVPASGTVARCTEERVELPSPIPGIRVTHVQYGAVVGLPDPQPGRIFVVSAIVLNALGGTRPDVFCPGPGIRDAEGKIIACDGLSQ